VAALRKVVIRRRRLQAGCNSRFVAIAEQANHLSMALLFRDCLENKRNKRRVLSAAELAHRLYDLGERNAPSSTPLARKAGCKARASWKGN